MAIVEKEVFTFRWQIENFSFCRHQQKQKITSPIFEVDFLESKWQLWIYPRGIRGSGNNFGIFLGRVCVDSEKVNIGYTFTLLSVAGNEIQKTWNNSVFETPQGQGCDPFCSREVILNYENGYLPNDTLTLTCEMWKIDDAIQDNSCNADVDALDDAIDDSQLLKQMYDGVAEDEMLSFQPHLPSKGFVAVTRINVQQKSIIWPITKFGELHPDMKLFIPIIAASNVTSSFLLMLRLTEDGMEKSAQIEIQRIPSKSKDFYFVKCKIIVFNATNIIRCVKEDEHFFDTDDVWKFPEFIEVEKLKKKKLFNSSKDVVYIRCVFSFSTLADASCMQTHVKKTNAATSQSKLSSNRSDTIGSMFKEMYDNDEFCDVIFRTGNRDFKAHKVVLAAYSPVFKAMFQNDMAEKENGTVNLTDIDEDTLNSMLGFMYGDDLRLSEHEEARKLYFAADKYEILSLMWLCSCFFKSSLTVSNVTSVLILADLHHDHDLMAETKNFIRFHGTEIFNSQVWVEFMQSDLKLASDVMFEMLKDVKL